MPLDVIYIVLPGFVYTPFQGPLHLWAPRYVEIGPTFTMWCETSLTCKALQQLQV